MINYRIVTDSACDMGEYLSEWGVPSISLTLKFDGEDNIRRNDEVEPVAFYNRMREGGVAKTSAVNPEEFALAFEPILAAGEDILYIGFSSGLSTTCNSGRIAADKLSEKYPERKIIVIDSLSASAGFGMLVYLAVRKKNEGASLEENAEYVTSLIPRLCHWFTVDDLVYLKRGDASAPPLPLSAAFSALNPFSIWITKDISLISSRFAADARQSRLLPTSSASL